MFGLLLATTLTAQATLGPTPPCCDHECQPSVAESITCLDDGLLEVQTAQDANDIAFAVLQAEIDQLWLDVQALQGGYAAMVADYVDYEQNIARLWIALNRVQADADAFFNSMDTRVDDLEATCP